ncbi:uncharacterized protein LOC124436568 [Xenia sp. Carnegie-2017]|uniref:uncharacterized protein LOC124436568 n=1 Tax=Xenia sp. Carnegie-2017 TaxID=2897299 RepID=UPI001F03643C|nr:uncharacterized protein LOC124436568 [Xenia sp. Carnegie-2017]
MNQIKTVAMRGIEEGSLIFEKASTSDFHELANCGLFHQIPHKTRSIYCFLHLTIQEFLSAMFVAENLQDIGKFLDDHSTDPKWHLVIQFIAGLLGQVKRLGNIRDREITEDIERRFKVWNANLIGIDRDKALGFLGLKCIYELQDKDVMRSACKIFPSEEMLIAGVSFTPVDLNALFEFIFECGNISKLMFKSCKFLNDKSCLAMKNFFVE